MPDALVKYKACKLVDKWSAPTKEQGQILALTAQVEQLKLKLSTRKPGPPNKPPPKSAKNGQGFNKWAWKNIMPKDAILQHDLAPF